MNPRLSLTARASSGSDLGEGQGLRCDGPLPAPELWSRRPYVTRLKFRTVAPPVHWDMGLSEDAVVDERMGYLAPFLSKRSTPANPLRSRVPDAAAVCGDSPPVRMGR